MRLPKLISFGVFISAVASLTVIWGMFATMWLNGTRSITVYANKFGEFWIELVVLTAAIIFLPVLLYELDERLIDNTE